MSNDDPLRVYIVTVDEYYYIPKFLRAVFEEENIEVVGITGVPPSLGTENTATFAFSLCRRFGPKIFAKHVAFYGKYMILDIYNRIRGTGFAYSPETLAQRHEVEYHHTKDVNSMSHVEHIDEIDPDVIASVAPPQKFSTELINLPNKCTINIHSSLLPDYRGLSPSFWTLLNNEGQTGVTVHYMDEELDSGDLIMQEPISITNKDTLHSLNERVASMGSTVLTNSLLQIAENEVEAEVMDPSQGSYYSLPEREDVKEFIDAGRRFY